MPYHFESLSKLEKTLQDLDACCDPLCDSSRNSAMPQAHDSTDYHLHVTELDEKHVTLDVQVTRGVSESDTTDTESHAYPTIEVIHRKQTPDLHGILKQRSRTISDSSDENGTVLSASPDSSSHEGHFPSVKKSVSFNERIDQTTFKTNSTVSSMHNALKSKRKRTRQREERRKNGRRRRRHSSQESSEGEEGHLKDKSDAPVTKGSHQGGQQHGKNSRKETRAAAAAAFNKNASKQDGTGSSSTVEETDETTNTEGSGHDTDSGCDNNDNNSKNSSKPESSSQSEDNNVDHYNLRPRGNRSSKSEPKNCYSTKNCSHNSIVVSGERMDNELTPEERTKLDRLMTAALNQTLSQMKPNLNDNSEHFEVVESLKTDVVEPSKTQVTDTMTHMASLSIGDGVKAPTEKEHVVSNAAVCNGQLVDVDNCTPPVVNNEDDGKSVVRVGSEAEKSRVKCPKEKSSDCNTKLKNNNAINGKKCQKSELDNFRSTPKIESTLSWTDTEYTKQQLSNEHHTECAFHFNNNVMFELD